jgi:hypothetical protein
MTLRNGVLIAGILLVLGSLVPIAYGGRPLAPLFVAGAVIVLGMLFERVVYKPVDAARPGPEWQRTAERFVDPASGETLTVFVKPATGERRYVKEAG